jgi:hypothetical protein
MWGKRCIEEIVRVAVFRVAGFQFCEMTCRVARGRPQYFEEPTPTNLSVESF